MHPNSSLCPLTARAVINARAACSWAASLRSSEQVIPTALSYPALEACFASSSGVFVRS